MSSTPPPDLELDCRGMLCPRPVIELAKHVADVPVGGLVAVVADDAAAAHDIPAWCRMRGQEYAGADWAADGVARYLVRRVQRDPRPQPRYLPISSAASEP